MALTRDNGRRKGQLRFSLETSRGSGCNSASSLDQKVLAGRSISYSKFFPPSESSEVSCPVPGFPCQGELRDSGGEQRGEGPWKGMMRPAASERRGPPSGQQREGEAVGKADDGGSHPRTGFFQALCSFTSLFFFLLLLLLEKMESCPEYILSLALVICHLLKNL